MATLEIVKHADISPSVIKSGNSATVTFTVKCDKSVTAAIVYWVDDSVVTITPGKNNEHRKTVKLAKGVAKQITQVFVFKKGVSASYSASLDIEVSASGASAVRTGAWVTIQ